MIRMPLLKLWMDSHDEIMTKLGSPSNILVNLWKKKKNNINYKNLRYLVVGLFFYSLFRIHVAY